MDRIEVGKMYKVTFDDCCVRGEFTATLSDICIEDICGIFAVDYDSKYGATFVFDNGVTITDLRGLEFKKV